MATVTALGGTVAAQQSLLEPLLELDLGGAPDRLASAERIWLVGTGPVSKHQPGRSELILNPTTGVLLSEEMISLSRKEGAPPGTVIAWSAIEDQGIVRSDHQRPPSLNTP